MEIKTVRVERAARKLQIACLRLCLLLSLLLLPMCAARAADASIYVCDAAYAGQANAQGIPVNAVQVYKKDSSRYLFLPAAWNASNLRVYLIGNTEIKLGDTVYQNGEQTDCFQPGTKVDVSAKAGGKYTIKIMQSANIPALFIATESGNVKAIKDDKTAREPGMLFMQAADGTIEYEGALEYIKARGNATFYFAKKPWQIKLAEKTSLCGMAADKKWILLANYVDKSLIRNTICLDMARASQAYAYVPGCRAIDLYINNAYWGSYLLTEKNEVDSNRLAITDLEKKTEALNDASLETMETFGQRLYSRNGEKGIVIKNEPEDYTGGYLLLADSRVYFAGETSGFVTARGQAFTFQSPKYASEKQVAYAHSLIQTAEDALFSADGTDEKTGRHYTELIDLTTFVNRYLQAEVTGEHDGQRPYFYKDSDTKDGLLYCAPVWDVDNTFGAFADHANARVFYICNDKSQAYYWFPQAMKQADFKATAIELYNMVYAPLLRALLGQETDPSGCVRSLDDYAAEVFASAQMDNVRWPIDKTRRGNFNARTGGTPEANVEYLRNYIARRLDFLNNKWGTAE